MPTKKLTVAHAAASSKFKHYALIELNTRNKIVFKRENVLAFLRDRGYFLYRTSPKDYNFVRVINNIVKIVGKKDVLDEVRNFIKANEDAFLYQEFLDGLGKWFPENFFLSMDETDVQIRRDTRDTMQVYFINTIVRVTKTQITTFPYTELDGYIWESQIIQREFTYITEEEIDTSHDFSRFCWNISAKDTNRLLKLCCALGYLIHNYKNPAVIPAVILNDEVKSDNPEGGTGKGLLGKALKYFISTVRIDGKVFDFSKSFGFSRVNDDTKLIFFDDVNKKFPFDKLFSTLSEGIITERKGLQETDLGFENSPKTLISSNYVMTGSGNSNNRRRHEIEIAQYYSESFKPDQEFGRLMFNEWELEDWNKFDNYLIQCGQLFLQKGLIELKTINIEEKRVTLDTSHSFIEFMDDYNLTGRIPKQQMFDDFIAKNPKYAKVSWFDRTKLQTWVKLYCDYKRINVLLEGYDTTKTVRCFRFDLNDKIMNSDKYLSEQNKKYEDENLPF